MDGQLNQQSFDYRHLLLDEFHHRRQRNESYSLRAYAKCLDVSVTYLSQLFSNKRNLSPGTGAKMVKKLNWPADRGRLFMKLIQYNMLPEGETRSDFSREIEGAIAPEFLDMEKDQFQTVAEWQHFAIVELIGLKGFVPTVTNIAKRLNLSRRKARESVERLIRVGLLTRQGNTLKKCRNFYRIKDVPSSAIRAFHHAHLKKAMLALDNKERDLRDITGTTLALDTNKLPEIKKLVAEFRNSLNKYCTSNGEPDSVYQLSVQLFRLDKELP